MKALYYCLSRLADFFAWIAYKLDDLTIALIKKYNPKEWQDLVDADSEYDVEVIDRGNTSAAPRG